MNSYSLNSCLNEIQPCPYTSPNNGDIMIRQKPHPKGPAKAIVSQSSAELSVLINKTVSLLNNWRGVFYV